MKTFYLLVFILFVILHSPHQATISIYRELSYQSTFGLDCNNIGIDKTCSKDLETINVGCFPKEKYIV